MTQTAKSYVCLAMTFVAFGVVGEMDYRTQTHVASIEAIARNA